MKKQDWLYFGQIENEKTTTDFDTKKHEQAVLNNQNVSNAFCCHLLDFFKK